MFKILLISFTVVLTLHGLIHLMGLLAYWPLVKISDLPYKTTLLGDRWEVGRTGMRIYSLFWLLATLSFVASALALLLGGQSWAPVLLSAAILSIVVCILDWKMAFRGAWIDGALLLILFVIFGLRVQPAPFPKFSAPGAPAEKAPLPAGLPAPVERFYRLTYGDTIPVYHSVVMTARGPLILMGITFPGRMRFSHISGEGYRHYIEATFYGLPILKVNESYLDGHARFEVPFSVVENDPCMDSSANQGLWAESLAYPAILLTDPRVRWEPMDETHAGLYVPYGDSEQFFTMQFDPQSGELIHFETNRCHDAKSGTLRWWGDRMYVESHNGQDRNLMLTAAWEDEGTPWIYFGIEEIAFNVDVSSYMRQKGP